MYRVASDDQLCTVDNFPYAPNIAKAMPVLGCAELLLSFILAYIFHVDHNTLNARVLSNSRDIRIVRNIH